MYKLKLVRSQNDISVSSTGNVILLAVRLILNYLTSIIRPSLEYYSSVWDPFQAKYISAIKSVQKLAAK